VNTDRIAGLFLVFNVNILFTTMFRLTYVSLVALYLSALSLGAPLAVREGSTDVEDINWSSVGNDFLNVAEGAGQALGILPGSSTQKAARAAATDAEAVFLNYGPPINEKGLKALGSGSGSASSGSGTPKVARAVAPDVEDINWKTVGSDIVNVGGPIIAAGAKLLDREEEDVEHINWKSVGNDFLNVAEGAGQALGILPGSSSQKSSRAVAPDVEDINWKAVGSDIVNFGAPIAEAGAALLAREDLTPQQSARAVAPDVEDINWKTVGSDIVNVGGPIIAAGAKLLGREELTSSVA